MTLMIAIAAAVVGLVRWHFFGQRTRPAGRELMELNEKEKKEKVSAPIFAGDIELLEK